MISYVVVVIMIQSLNQRMIQTKISMRFNVAQNIKNINLNSACFSLTTVV